MWQLRMHCNLTSTDPLIRTPCKVWSRWTYPLPYYSVFAADTLLYAVTFDLWPWTFAMTWRNSVPNFNAIRGGVIAISILYWSNDLERLVKYCAQLWDNFHEVWPLITYPCLNYSVFMLIRYVTLWPWPLTRWPW